MTDTQPPATDQDTPGFWIRITPAGCVTGSVHTDTVGHLAEDAHREFTPLIANRRREAAEGYRYELVDSAEWSRRARPCLKNRCNH